MRPESAVLEDLFEHLDAPLAIVSRDGHWLRLNSSAGELLGRPASALQGARVQDAVCPEDVGTLDGILAAEVATPGDAYHRAVRFNRGNGTHAAVRVRRVPTGDGGLGAAAVLWHLSDLGGRAGADRERSAFFDIAPEPLVIASISGYILEVNPAWVKLLGWSADDMRGRPFLDFVHPDDRARTLAEGERAAAGTPDRSFRNRYRARDGRYVWLEWRCELNAELGRFLCVARDVTEQEVARRVLEDEAAQQRTALLTAEQMLDVHATNTPLAVVELDATLTIRAWSPRAVSLFGFTEAETVGRQPLELEWLHPDDAASLMGTLRALEGGQAASLACTLRNCTRARTVVHCEWFNSAVYDAEGNLRSILMFAQDVTARLAAEAEAAEREELFRATFEKAPVGIAFLGLEGQWLGVNDTLCRFLGYTERELLAMSFQDITHPDDLDADLGLLQQLLAGRIDRYDMRKRYIGRDGMELWAKLTVSLRRDATQQPLHLISVIEDIRPEVAAESALHAAHAELEQRVLARTHELEQANRALAAEVAQRRAFASALRSSEALTRSILENSHDAFIATDDRGDIIEWNRSAEHTFGWSRAEVLGRPMDQFIVPERMRVMHRTAMLRFIETGESRLLRQRLQLPAVDRTGREFPIELTISAVELDGRKVLSAFLHDISQRVEAEQKLQQSEARLRTITDNVPALIAYVGPDLRYQFVNEGFRDWYGLEPDQCVGQPVRQILGETVFRTAEPHLQRAAAGERVTHEREQTARDGAVRYTQATYVPDLSADADGRHGFYALVQDITPQKQLMDVLERRALRDELTGLPNRSAWTEELERGLARARRHGTSVAVMFLDLDGFKQINDRHGHRAGDAVLKEFASRLRASLRASDLIARLAGDEFVVFLDRLSDVEGDPPTVAKKVLLALDAPVVFEGAHMKMSASIGIATQRGPVLDAEQLLQAADEAMYTAKRGAERRYCVLNR